MMTTALPWSQPVLSRQTTKGSLECCSQQQWVLILPLPTEQKPQFLKSFSCHKPFMLQSPTKSQAAPEADITVWLTTMSATVGRLFAYGPSLHSKKTHPRSAGPLPSGQLSNSPSLPAVLRSCGGPLRSLGYPGRSLADVAPAGAPPKLP